MLILEYDSKQYRNHQGISAKTNHVILHPSICGAVLFISTKRFTTA